MLVIRILTKFDDDATARFCVSVPHVHADKRQTNNTNHCNPQIDLDKKVYNYCSDKFFLNDLYLEYTYPHIVKSY